MVKEKESISQDNRRIIYDIMEVERKGVVS